MRTALLFVAALPLCACSVLDSDVGRGVSGHLNADTAVVFTTADVRVITERPHPVLGRTVLCVEPAPDVTKAIATALTLKAAGGNGAATGSLGGSGSSAEAVAELAGRSTALLGLRDGLYRACEAYSNGIIGQDAYGLVIARYSDLMTTLFLAQDITGAAGAEGRAVEAASIAGAGDAGQPASPKPAPPAAAGKVGDQVNFDPRAPLTLIAATPPGPAPAPPKTKPPASGDVVPATMPASAILATSALAIARMNEDYLHDGAFGILLVACINNGDPTRFRNGLPPNAWLQAFCSKLDTLKALKDLSNVAASTALINPAPSSATKPLADKPAPVQLGDPTIRAVQQALARLKCSGCDPGRIDGIAGQQTRSAVGAYQASKALTPNGDPLDAQFLRSLGIRFQRSSSQAPARAVQL